MSRDQKWCTLTDGRKVDLNTPHGADAYLTQANFPPFSKTLKALKKKGKKKMNRQVKSDLKVQMNMFGALFENASKAVLDKTAYEELVAWISFLKWVLEVRTNCLRNGTWHDECFDEDVFFNIGSTLRHCPCSKIMRKRELFHTMADFMTAHKSLPCDGVAESLCTVVTNLFASLNVEDGSMCVENLQKYFSRLESCGILVHYLKCSTCPPTWNHTQNNKSRYEILGGLQQCTDLIRKRFFIGSPCGDMVEAILLGREGHRTHKDPRIYIALRNISQISASINTGVQIKKQSKQTYICRLCKKTGDDFKSCANCKTTFYCSRDCQKKDWKVHKKTCITMTRDMNKTQKSGNAMVWAFLEKHGNDVLSALKVKCEETGLTRKDLVVELDFSPEANGVLAPSLRDQAYFKIGVTKNYYEGDRTEEPYWLSCHKGTEHYQAGIDDFVQNISRMHAKMTNEYIMICVMYPTNYTSVIRIPYGQVSMTAFEAMGIISQERIDEMMNLFLTTRARID